MFIQIKPAFQIPLSGATVPEIGLHARLFLPLRYLP